MRAKRRRLAAAGAGVVAVVVATVVVATVAACDDGGTTLPAASAPPDASQLATQLLRGEYLVRSVAGCGECHTPRDASGQLIQGMWLGGVANRFDLTPDDDTTGGISAPNLTPAGLASWTDAQIKSAFLDGVDASGKPLFPLMPYYTYHNMSAPDADAIVAYLRAVPPVAGTTPPRQPLPPSVGPLTAPAPPIAESNIPQTTLPTTDPDYAESQAGRYLAGEVGFCLDCHTAWRLGVVPPLDLTRPFAGGRAFSSHEWGAASTAPAVVYSSDVTPDPTGIAGWTANDVAKALVDGTPPGGGASCAPMPSGPTGALGGLTPADAHAIGTYLTTLAPIVGDGFPACGAGADAAAE